MRSQSLARIGDRRTKRRARSLPMDGIPSALDCFLGGCGADFRRRSITFEPVPSDFAILKIHTLPETGGDTLWVRSLPASVRVLA